MLRKILFILLVIVAVVALAFGYVFIRNSKRPVGNCLHYLPANAYVVIESANTAALSHKLAFNNLIWENLKGIPSFSPLNSFINGMDSLSQGNEDLRNLSESAQLITALYTASIPDSSHFISAFQLPEIGTEKKFIEWFEVNSKPFVSYPGKNGTVYKFGFKENASVWYFGISNGVVLFSDYADGIDLALGQKPESAVAADKNFSSLYQTSGSGADARCYVNLNRLPVLYSWLNWQYLHPETTAQKGWVEMDIQLKPNALLFNGFTQVSQSPLFQTIQAQSPCSFDFYSLAPARTTSFLAYGITDAEIVKKTYLHPKTIKETDDYFNDKVDVPLSQALNELRGEEHVFLRVGNIDTTFLYAFHEVKDANKTVSLLENIKDSVIQLDSTKAIFTIANPGFYQQVSLGLFDWKPRYCMRQGDYLVFGESPFALQKLLDDVVQNQTLQHQEKFQTFKNDHLSDEANVFLYSVIAGGENFLSTFLQDKAKNFYFENLDHLIGFNAFGLQLSSQKGKIFNQAFLLYSPQSNEGGNSVWETSLDTLCVMQPQEVINHKTQGKELVVQDLAHNLYLIGNTGKILWKKKLDSPIMGKVYQVDYYNNGRLQLLFNTKQHIYLIDRNGVMMPDYPIQLAAEATNALVVFDYEFNKDYRVLLACADRKIYNYTLKAKPVEGFIFPPTPAPVFLPVVWQRIGAKDYLIICDSLGHVYGTGRRGETRINFTAQLPTNIRDWHFVCSRELPKSYVYALDKERNRIVSLSMDNHLVEKRLENDLKTKSSFYIPIQSGQVGWFGIADENGFKIFSDLGEEKVNFFTKTEMLPIVFPLMKDREHYFLIPEKESGKLVMVSKSGEIIPTSPYYAQTLPMFSKINNDANTYLITVHRNKVICSYFDW